MESQMVTVRGNIAEFSFFRPKARKVSIVGDFNGWSISKMPMKRLRDGYWAASLRLPEGDFKFRYYADGEWYVDYAGFGLDHGRFGPDSVVRIS